MLPMLPRRRPVLLFGGAVAGGFWTRSFAQSASAQQEADVVKDRLLRFLERLDALSKATPPPGLNATNGHFVTAVRAGDIPLAQLVSEEPRLASDEGKFLWTRYQAFATGLRGAFAVDLHDADVTTATFPIFQAVYEATNKQILDFVTTVVSSGFSLDAAKKALEDIQEALRGKVVTSGSHGNGWMSNSVYEACERFVGQEHSSPAVTTDTGKKTLSVMQNVCRGWMTLPAKRQNEDRHKPWLTADWQAGFESIAAAGAAAIR